MSFNVLRAQSLLALLALLASSGGGCVDNGVCLDNNTSPCLCYGGVPGVSQCSSGQWGPCQCLLDEDLSWPDVLPDLADLPDTGDDEEQTVTPKLRYVRLSDRGMTVTSPSGGADLDAVILFKQDGRVVYADRVEYFRHGGGYTGADLDAILGFPDSFPSYPNVERCDIDRGFVSLGGLGGEVVVRMPLDMEGGDRLVVLEVGGCDYGSGIAISDEYDVSVSVSADLAAVWIMLGIGAGPESSFSMINP